MMEYAIDLMAFALASFTAVEMRAAYDDDGALLHDEMPFIMMLLG